MYLVLLEISKKQDYIFKSNRLKENIGASFIVKHVTEELPKELLKNTEGRAVFQGGGKSLFIFESENETNAFIRDYSKKVIKEYSGVELFIVKELFDITKDNVIEKIDLAYKKLSIKKSQRKYSVHQLSFGIEKVCASTGLSAIKYNKDNNLPISKEIDEKLKAYKLYSKNDYFKELFGKEIEYSKDFDSLLNEEDDKKYIAITHIDGNNMGNKFEELKEFYKKIEISDYEKFNNLYLNDLKNMSQEIANIYEKCFLKATNELIENDKFIKLRPLILAGDDITFVCNGKIAIKAARLFLENLRKESLTIGNNKVSLNACAGIAILKSNYPFSRGYKLAEELCQNCKSYLKLNMKEEASLIDWHIVQGEIEGSLENIRKKYYKLESANLTMKPYIVDSKQWNSIKTFGTTLEIVKDKEIPRSKIKELREIYIGGREKTKIYMLTNGLEKIGILSNKFDYINNFKCEFGFKDNYAAFYDAIEVIDFVEEI